MVEPSEGSSHHALFDSSGVLDIPVHQLLSVRRTGELAQRRASARPRQPDSIIGNAAANPAFLDRPADAHSNVNSAVSKSSFGLLHADFADCERHQRAHGPALAIHIKRLMSGFAAARQDVEADAFKMTRFRWAWLTPPRTSSCSTQRRLADIPAPKATGASHSGVAPPALLTARH